LFWTDRFIASCASWSEFWEGTKRLSSAGEKGVVFERLTQLYLQTVPEYQSELAHIWTLREVPPDVRKLLALPTLDEGIDFIARTRNGKYWAIQSKFRSQHDKPLTRKELGTFTSLAFNTCNNIALAVVAHTASKPVSKRHLMRNTTEIGLDRWQSLNQEAWSLIIGKLKGKSAAPKARTPRPHQSAAVAAAKTHFVRDGASRGRLIMPCGTGKSLTAYWIAEGLKAKTILVAVPSLALVRQCLTDWTREFLAHGIKPDWLCVCSDETVGNLERDEFVGEVYDLGLPTHTDTNEIAALLRARSSGPKIVFTTYQSSGKLAAAARKARIKFDLAILDEAHKTVGVHSKTFATLLSDKKIKIQRRVFMTATERVFRGDRSDVLSMDNEKDYGARFFQLSFKEAIEQKIITDYKILTMMVTDGHIRELIDQNRILNLNSHDLDEAEAQSVATGIALKRIYKRHGVKHAISFHRSIRGADRFREQQDALNRTSSLGPKTTNFHISSKKTAGQRSDLLREFVVHKRALMTNARCLTEGVDVPAIDCVMFADPKQSRVDIVQAAGRALRPHEGNKEHGYIVVPLVVPEKMDFEKFAETTAFKQVAQTITALSTQDERIADEFRAIVQGRVSSGKIIEIEGDIPVGMKMKLGDFAEAISTRLWQSVGRANWRKFDDAREFVRALGLNSHVEWWQWTTGRLRRPNLPDLPPDIPAGPDSVYPEEWKNWADWLGHSRRIGGWRSFKDARKYARSLKLRSHKEWTALTRDRTHANAHKLPDDIPSYPNNVYEEWIGWWEWLGTPNRRGRWQSYSNARTLARKLGLKSEAQFINWRSGRTKHKIKCPIDMPMHPDRVYSVFVSWPDFLGFIPVSWLPFDQAREFVCRQKLRSRLEYRDWATGRLSRRGLSPKPNNIPSNPDQIYSDKWQGFNNFLGTPKSRTIGRTWRPFKRARAYVRSLKLSNFDEYTQWTKGKLKNKPNFPDDIPVNVYGIYGKEKEWKGVSEFLGSEPSAKYVEMWPFEKSRAFVQTLKLQSSTEYARWAGGALKGVRRRPPEIPIVPRSKYRKQWRDWDDWLGRGS
jgi:superfamily II DNA or RNA helicase